MSHYASEITRLRKEGKLPEALERARACHDAVPGDIHIQRAYGLVLYGILKQELEDLESLRMSRSHFAHRFELWLAEYQVFGGKERPDLLHSCMLNLALKASRSWPGFLQFARWWGPQHLRAEDREPYTPPGGKPIPSVEMRLYYAIGRGLLEQAQDADPELRRWAGEQLLAALERYPDDLWLNHYRSKWLLDQGEIDQARKCTASVVRRQRKATWPWALPGQTFEAHDSGSAITCYFHAVQLAREPMELANTRVSLARLLAQRQRFDEAAVQVHQALGYRARNGFKVPQDLQQLASSGWFRQRPDLAALPFEPDVALAAHELLRSQDDRPLVFRPGVVDHQNPHKSLAHVAFSADEGSILPYGKFAGAEQLQPGQVVEVGYVQGHKAPVCFKVSTAAEIEDFCRRMSRGGQSTRRAGIRLSEDSAGRARVHPSCPLDEASIQPIQRSDRMHCLHVQRQAGQGGLAGTQLGMSRQEVREACGRKHSGFHAKTETQGSPSARGPRQAGAAHFTCHPKCSSCSREMTTTIVDPAGNARSRMVPIRLFPERRVR
nr:hypothetical protein [Caldimonas tepidiphila]